MIDGVARTLFEKPEKEEKKETRKIKRAQNEEERPRRGSPETHRNVVRNREKIETEKKTDFQVDFGR